MTNDANSVMRNHRRAFGRYVRQLRRQENHTQEQLCSHINELFRAAPDADKTHFHPTYLSGIERGVRNPSLEKIFMLATALDVAVSELFD